MLLAAGEPRLAIAASNRLPERYLCNTVESDNVVINTGNTCGVTWAHQAVHHLSHLNLLWPLQRFTIHTIAKYHARN